MNVDKTDPAAKEINKQLQDFDECWNGVAKEVIDRIQLVILSFICLRFHLLEKLSNTSCLLLAHA